MSSLFILLAALALHLFSPSLTTNIILPTNNSGSFLSMCHASPCLWNRIPASLHQNHNSLSISPLPAPVRLSHHPLLFHHSAPITTSLFHSWIKTYLFTKSFPLQTFCPLSGVRTVSYTITWIISSELYQLLFFVHFLSFSVFGYIC